MKSESLLDTFSPTMSFAVGLCGVCVWVYTTFATVSALNQEVTQLNMRINDKYQQAIDHSDANYAKMSSQMTALQVVMVEMRDTLKHMQERVFERRSR